MLKFLKILFVGLLISNISYAQISTKEVKELLDKHFVEHKDVILRIAILETGYFKSNKAVNHKNLFGFETGKKHFSTYEESVLAFKTRVYSRLKKGENFYTFLKRIGYAADKNYIYKLKKIKT